MQPDAAFPLLDAVVLARELARRGPALAPEPHRRPDALDDRIAGRLAAAGAAIDADAVERAR